MHAFNLRKIPKRLAEKEIHLELVGPMKWPRLYRLLRHADCQSLQQLGFTEKQADIKAFLLLLYLFRLSYLICMKDKTVGIAGIYGWQPNVHLYLTLAILDRSYRAMGIGSVSFGLLTRWFLKSHLCQNVFVEVKKDNTKGLNFWKKQGFKMDLETKSTYVLKFSLKNV